MYPPRVHNKGGHNVVDPLTREQINERSIRTYATELARNCNMIASEDFIAAVRDMLSEFIDKGWFAFDAEAPEKSTPSKGNPKKIAKRMAVLYRQAEARLKDLGLLV
jgi:hypothetical protein